jgi:hypothetical protein
MSACSFCAARKASVTTRREAITLADLAIGARVFLRFIENFDPAKEQ